MKKKEKKVKSVKATVSKPVELITEVTASEVCIECKKIDRLDIVFNNDDLNRMRDKINEIIENQ